METYRDKAINYLEMQEINGDTMIKCNTSERFIYIYDLISNFAEKILMKTDFPALKLFEKRLESGCYIRKQDDKWWLFDKNDEGVASGDTLAKMLVSLIFMDA